MPRASLRWIRNLVIEERREGPGLSRSEMRDGGKGEAPLSLLCSLNTDCFTTTTTMLYHKFEPATAESYRRMQQVSEP
jgi:hypothetical protein